GFSEIGPLNQGPAAGAAGARRAAVAVVAEGDPSRIKGFKAFDLPNRPPPASHGNFQHLIEVAVVDLPIPADRYKIAAHDSFRRARIELVHQEIHVFLKLSL